MATVDLSRDATDFRKRYSGVRMQQGRCLTDDDFNDAARIDEEDMRRTRVDVIGPVGSPDAGFLPAPPAAPLPTPGKVEFDISAGTLYLGGLRLEQAAGEPFHLQKDWLNFAGADWPDLPASGSRIDLVWVEAWRQPVAAEEDSEKFEAALGSADTAMNVRTMRRVRVRPDVKTEDCAEAWQIVTGEWASEGTMAPDMELATGAKLQVTYTTPPDPGDLCSPPAAGGYLGAENQAVRVQLVDGAHYTWGFDNAAPIYRVHVSQITRNGVLVTQITLLTPPKDAVHWPLEGQVIELLPWSAALPNGETLAELSGHLARVTASYNPDEQTLEIDTAPPAGFGTAWQSRSDAADFFDGTPADDYFFLRVWNRGDDLTSPLAIPVANGDLGTTGLHVDFSGGPLRPHDHWIIGARPATPDQVVPWRLEDVSGTPPHGVKRYRAPLGLIRWTAGSGTAAGQLIHDCRPPFQPLTRLKGCCTVTVGNGTTSFGMFTKIQDAVDALPPKGGTVCVLPGTYTESVRILNRQNIVIHGCDARARVEATIRDDQEQPAFLIVDSVSIAIERLSIEAGPRSAVEIVRTERAAVRQCVIQMRDVPTIYQSIWARGENLVIERNLIDVLSRRDQALAGGAGAVLNGPFDGTSPPPPPQIAHATRGGIQIGGGSARVRILANVIRGGTWNGITLGSLLLSGGDGREDEPDKPGSFDPCDPCKPLDQTGDDPTGGDVDVRSAGDLRDIEIRDNHIAYMGANGIGVVRFFDPGKSAVLVGVRGLHIASNRIHRCVRREINPPAPPMHWFIGYGGISLAVAHDLRITDNEIDNNGAGHIEPICGVFALAVEHAQIDRNRITDNGPRLTEHPAAAAKAGTRGGIWIWFAYARPPELAPVRDLESPDTSGVPAALIRDNVIVVPIGRPITLFGAGAFTIARNRLVSQSTSGQDLELFASTVLAGNLGISNEWTMGLLFVTALLLVWKGKMPPQMDACALAKYYGLTNPDDNSRWPPLTLKWPSGKTLVTENQIACRTIDERGGFTFSSVAVGSLDDVGFADNQCEIESVWRLFSSNVLAGGGSVRMTGNRLSETWLRASFSGRASGLMSTVSDNQATHCLTSSSPLPGMRILTDNLSFIEAFCPQQCGYPKGGGV